MYLCILFSHICGMCMHLWRPDDDLGGYPLCLFITAVSLVGYRASQFSLMYYLMESCFCRLPVGLTGNAHPLRFSVYSMTQTPVLTSLAIVLVWMRNILLSFQCEYLVPG